MTDFSKNDRHVVLGTFFENVFSQKGVQKNSQKGVCLAGKILVNLPPPFAPYKTPPLPIKHKIGKLHGINIKMKVHIYIYIYIYFLLIHMENKQLA